VEGRSAAAIGRIEASKGGELAAFLEDLVAECRNLGIPRVLAPLDGDTWHSYRIAVGSSERPFFAMEPPADRALEAALRAAGFQASWNYSSAEVKLHGEAPPQAAASGLRVRSFEVADGAAELQRMYQIASLAFQRAPLFTPIDFESFAALYRPALEKLVPELALFLEDEHGAAVGFLFGFPDWAEGNTHPRAAILKTYASLRQRGGSLLAQAFHEQARRLGFSSVIHALMHEDNRSRLHSKGLGGEPFRRYALFSRHTGA
jgi:hypothetical protein